MKCYNCNATQATPLLSCPNTAVCGTPFGAKSLNWGKAEPSAVYVDKVFSAHEAKGSSLFYALNTAETPENFVSVYELTPCSGGGCCGVTTLSEDAVFEIQKSYVQLDCFSVAETATTPGDPSGVITPDQVTVNGTAVTAITVANGRYTADISALLPDLLNPVCVARGLPSKAFILLQNIGPLEFRIRFGFEGVVRSCGTLYRFKIYLANNAPIALPAEQTTSFAIAEANLPCIERGNAPVVSFRFGGLAEVINPQLSVTVVDDTDPCNGVTVNLLATLGFTPLLFAEVVRNTLMLVSGSELEEDCACGLSDFRIFAGEDCCGCEDLPPASRSTNTSGILRGCGCNGTGKGKGGNNG